VFRRCGALDGAFSGEGAMARGLGLAACAAVFAAAGAAEADELVLGAYAHDVTSVISERGIERGQDIEVAYRTAPVEALKAIGRPMLYAEYVGNDARRTSYGGVGFAWRMNWLHDRLYGQLGFGAVIHDGVDKYQNPDAPGLTAAQMDERLYIERNYKQLGSRFLFHPSAALGLRLSSRWSAEAVWNHVSNAGILAHINPGMDDFGGRLVFRFGPGRR
jgi:hypothetical protein